MEIQVAIRSYRRPKTVKTHKLLEDYSIWVPEDEYDSYAAIHGEDRVYGVPQEWDGHAARKKNYILDNIKADYFCLLDDDVSMLAFWEGGVRQYFTPRLFHEFLHHGFCLARQLGVRLWGVNQGKDAMIYRTQHPFSFLSPVLDPMLCHIKPELRYDERFSLKSDYDFWLQNVKTYRKTLRFNKYHYTHDHGDMHGGIVSYRTLESEKQMAYMLQKKWGSNIVKIQSSKGGKSASGNNILNIRIECPIKGM